MAFDFRLYQDSEGRDYRVGPQPLGADNLQVLLREDAASGSNGYLRSEPLFLPPPNEVLPSSLTSAIGVPPGIFEMTGYAPQILLTKAPAGVFTLTGYAPALTVRKKDLAYVGGQTASVPGTTSAWTAVPFALQGGFSRVPQEGDLVVIGYAIGSDVARSPTPAISAPSGYTALSTYTAQSGLHKVSLRLFYKFMGSTPDTSVTMGATGNLLDAGGINIRVYRGVDTSQVLDVGISSAGASGNTFPDDMPNPATITPTSVLSAILAFGAFADTSGLNYSPPPELDGSTFLSIAQSDAIDVVMASGHSLNWEAGAVDIGPFIAGATSANAALIALTIALRPAALVVAQPNQLSALMIGWAPEIYKTVVAPVGTFTLTGYAPTISTNGAVAVTVEPDAGAYALTGYAPEVTRQFRVDPAAGAYALTGYAPEVTRQLLVAPAAGAYALTGYAPLTARALLLSSVVGSYALTGYAPAITRQLRVDPAAGGYVLTGYAPALARQLLVAPATGAFALTGYAPAIGRNYVLNAVAGALVLTGFAPALLRGYRVDVPARAFTLTGLPPSILRALRIDPAAGDFDLTGFVPSLPRGYTQPMPEGIFELVGYPPELTVTTYGRVQLWNGSAWVLKPMMVWDGEEWVQKPVLYWNGSEWVGSYV